MKSVISALLGVVVICLAQPSGASNRAQLKQQAIKNPKGFSFKTNIQMTLTFDASEADGFVLDGDSSTTREFRFVKGHMYQTPGRLYYLDVNEEGSGYAGYENPDLVFHPEIRAFGGAIDDELGSDLQMFVSYQKQANEENPMKHIFGFLGVPAVDGIMSFSSFISKTSEKDLFLFTSYGLESTTHGYGILQLARSMVPRFSDSLPKAYEFVTEILKEANPDLEKFEYNFSTMPMSQGDFKCRTEWDTRVTCSVTLEYMGRVVVPLNKVSGETL